MSIRLLSWLTYLDMVQTKAMCHILLAGSKRIPFGRLLSIASRTPHVYFLVLKSEVNLFFAEQTYSKWRA